MIAAAAGSNQASPIPTQARVKQIAIGSTTTTSGDTTMTVDENGKETIDAKGIKTAADDDDDDSAPVDLMEDTPATKDETNNHNETKMDTTAAVDDTPDATAKEPTTTTIPTYESSLDSVDTTVSLSPASLSLTSPLLKQEHDKATLEQSMVEASPSITTTVKTSVPSKSLQKQQQQALTQQLHLLLPTLPVEVQSDFVQTPGIDLLIRVVVSSQMPANAQRVALHGLRHLVPLLVVDNDNDDDHDKILYAVTHCRSKDKQVLVSLLQLCQNLVRIAPVRVISTASSVVCNNSNDNNNNGGFLQDLYLESIETLFRTSHSSHGAVLQLLVQQDDTDALCHALQCRQLHTDAIPIVQNVVARYIWSSSSSSSSSSSHMSALVAILSYTDKVVTEILIHRLVCQHNVQVLWQVLQQQQQPYQLQLYTNFDCDTACTNLYQRVIEAIGLQVLPTGWTIQQGYMEYTGGSGGTSEEEDEEEVDGDDGLPPPVSYTERLGMEALWTALDQIPLEIKDKDAAIVQKLQASKQRKDALVQVAAMFNDENKEWMTYAIQQSVLEDTDDQADALAAILYTVPQFDSTAVGMYLSKGPDEQYPLHAAVRRAFCARYQFANLDFCPALRLFLSKFRLPGEAQCIDRFMEAFSYEYHRQNNHDMSLFAHADAVYVLSFSTIMLNTDLHNPNLAKERKMTQEQFIRNNRGINQGADLPTHFLAELYAQIKQQPIQVRTAGTNEDDLPDEHVWDNLVAQRSAVAPVVTVAGGGFFSKRMLEIVAGPALESWTGIFLRSDDDVIVARALDGLTRLGQTAARLDCPAVLTQVLQVLLPHGRDYVMNQMAQEMNGLDGHASMDSLDSEEQPALEDIPYGLLETLDVETDEERPVHHGAANHRGLLALDRALYLLQHGQHTAWSDTGDCLSALRDAGALPSALCDLDDFADAQGHLLPPSNFSRMASKRLADFYRVATEKDHAQQRKRKGWLRSLFKRKNSKMSDAAAPDDSVSGGLSVATPKEDLSPMGKTLLSIVEAAGIEGIVQAAATTQAPEIIPLLLDKLDAYPFKKDPIGENNAIFALELATRALLANRDKATELFNPFLTKFETILGMVSPNKVPAPFVIERIVVTILRCAIHLYALPELQPTLRAALHLVLIHLPKSFLRVMADRMACGLAIIVRSSYQHFDSHNDWTLLGDTLDMLAHYRNSRVFVFDGIASVVEYTLVDEEEERKKKKKKRKSKSKELEEIPEVPTTQKPKPPQLTKAASDALCKIMMRFVLGFYQNDTTFSVPGLLCLEKLYGHICVLLEKRKRQQSGNTTTTTTDTADQHPSPDLWQNVTVAIYSVVRHADYTASKQGLKSFGRIVTGIPVYRLPAEQWINVLFLLVHKQPTSIDAKSHACMALGQLTAHVLPVLSHDETFRDDLDDFVEQWTGLMREYLRSDRTLTLFAKTLQTVTYLSNHMVSDEWNGDRLWSTHVSETLLSELEQVGAAGGSVVHQKLVQKQ